MFEFLLQKGAVQGAQKYINKLEPKVNVHVPVDIPLASIGIIKRMAAVGSKINGLEEGLSKLSDDDLRAKTVEFKARYKEKMKVEREKLETLRKQHEDAREPQE